MAGRKTRAKGYDSVRAHLEHKLRSPRFRKVWEQTQREMALATALIRLRAEQGLTQAQLAEMVKTSQSSLSRLENNPPRKETPLLRKLADFYGCDLITEVRLVPKAG